MDSSCAAPSASVTSCSGVPAVGRVEEVRAKHADLHGRILHELEGQLRQVKGDDADLQRQRAVAVGEGEGGGGRSAEVTVRLRWRTPSPSAAHASCRAAASARRTSGRPAR